MCRDEKAALQVGMTEEVPVQRKQQRFQRIAQGDEVLVFVERRSMHELRVWHVVELEGPCGEALQPFQVSASADRESTARPGRRSD